MTISSSAQKLGSKHYIATIAMIITSHRAVAQDMNKGTGPKASTGAPGGWATRRNVFRRVHEGVLIASKSNRSRSSVRHFVRCRRSHIRSGFITASAEVFVVFTRLRKAEAVGTTFVFNITELHRVVFPATDRTYLVCAGWFLRERQVSTAGAGEAHCLFQ